jgi:hypothetical protein
MNTNHVGTLSTMTARSLSLVAGTLLLGAASLAAPATLDDYQRGIRVDPVPGKPLVEMALPDEVYLGVTRADLGDVRVFNAEGVAVAHAFCSAPEQTRPEINTQSLPVYELRDALRSANAGASVEVQTPGGTQVTVQEEDANTHDAQSGRTHIIDARSLDAALRAIQFDWASPDGASEARVRIEASRDLDRWSVIVPGSTLLRAASGDQEIRRERIDLPERQYAYLRVQRVDGGPPLQIISVTAEAVLPAQAIEPVWFNPRSLSSVEPGVHVFESDRLAPLQFARLQMIQDNSSVRARLQSRPDDKQPWVDRWSGESYLVVTATERRESPTARFAPTTDRHWRMLVVGDAQGQAPPILQLGYRPARLRFLAQGSAPYTVAFGSRRAERYAAPACNALLADVSGKDLEGMVGEIYALGPPTVLGGDAALKPLPKKTPVRLVVLWSVLVAGVGLLVAMALSLLKRVRPTG